MKDKVDVKDYIELSGDGQVVRKGPVYDKEPVYIEGFFSMYARERGKIVPGSRREAADVGHFPSGSGIEARALDYLKKADK